ncbi:KilA-N domain-containing protein [Nostoc sp. CHAB 5844]|nr:KilA-N domain-containing protein [Nostoc sp. CHAB 5844]
MLTHLWRDSEINQMPQDEEIGKYSIPKGYVNATQMCHANNKSWGHYKERKSTKAYWTALSNDIGIPISSLIIEIDGYGSSQGTWVHPEIAIDLAQWVSVEFRLWANRTLMKVMTAQEPVQQQSMTQIQLLVAEGCQLRVIDLPGPQKGVDDFIVAQGCDAFHALYNTAVALELWEIKLFTLLTYPPAIALNQRFLSGLIAPEGEKLFVLKAPKGTGKTEWLSQEVAKAHDQGRRVLIITHRIQLGEALCDRFGVNYVTEVRTNETGALLGYGVCVDSLHKDSQARFNPNDWSNDVIIINVTKNSCYEDWLRMDTR